MIVHALDVLALLLLCLLLHGGVDILVTKNRSHFDEFDKVVNKVGVAKVQREKKNKLSFRDITGLRKL